MVFFHVWKEVDPVFRVDTVPHDGGDDIVIRCLQDCRDDPLDFLFAGVFLQKQAGFYEGIHALLCPPEFLQLGGRGGIYTADDEQDLFLSAFPPGTDHSAHQCRSEGTGIHRHDFFPAGDAGICDQIEILLGDAVHGENADSPPVQRPDLLRQCIVAVYHVFEPDGRDRISALLPEQSVYFRDSDRAFGIAGDIRKVHGHSVYQQAVADNDPSRGGKAGDGYGDVVLPQAVQHGIRLASQVSAERGIDPLSIEEDVIIFECLSRCKDSAVGFCRIHTPAVRGIQKAVIFVQQFRTAMIRLHDRRCAVLQFCQQYAGRVRPGQIICYYDTCSHIPPPYYTCLQRFRDT